MDWESGAIAHRIREFLEEPAWGDGDTGIRAGRDVARQIMETWYGKQDRPARGIRSYEDYREMLEQEPDIQGVVNITPDHQHGRINISALRKGKAAISHKPRGERARTRCARVVQAARTSTAPSHLLAYSNNAGPAHARGMDQCRRHRRRARSPQLDEPAVLAAGHAGVLTRRGRRCPAGFNWALWQGPEPERPYHPSYTFAVYRGWYAYGTGCLGDMGHYSLWQPYRILNLGVPEFVEARPQQRRVRRRAQRERRRPRVARRPSARRAPSGGVTPRPRIGRRWTRSGTTAG